MVDTTQEGDNKTESPLLKYRHNTLYWLRAIKSPLARQLIGYTVLFSSLITFAVSGLQLYRTFRQDVSAIESTIEQIRSSRLTSIIESVWVLDSNLVQIQIEGIAQTPDIESVAIIVNEKPKWSSGESKSNDPVDYTIDLSKTENNEIHHLGELRVTADMSAVRGRVKDAAVLVLIGNAIKTFLVSFFFFMMFYFLLGRYLVLITKYAGQYRPGMDISPLTLDRSIDKKGKEKDELTFLVESLNRMIFMIDDYRIKLSKNEKIALQSAANLAIANEELEEFSARTSHDLRAPIISALALLEVSNESLDQGQTGTAKEGITHALKSLTSLKELIDNITQLALIKKQEESKSHVDFSSLLNESLALLSGMNGFSEIEVRKELNFNAPLEIKKMRLRVIVDNLISNAIKYHDPSEKISYIHITTWEKEGNFIFQVKDNGLGIPEEYEKDLFKMFMRFHKNVAYGSGMGMHLMKTSADKLGAVLEYKNPGQGSLFKLTIPLRGSDDDQANNAG